MSSSAKASLHLKFESEKQVGALLCALNPEAKAPPTHRSTVKLQKNGTNLTLTVEAEDTVALRATLNAYLHWITSILNVIGTVKKQ
jgi:tRNA threonylcarbamoyladenosine modification (KEOPS) complex  Pcc1 subunit